MNSFVADMVKGATEKFREMHGRAPAPNEVKFFERYYTVIDRRYETIFRIIVAVIALAIVVVIVCLAYFTGAENKCRNICRELGHTSGHTQSDDVECTCTNTIEVSR